MPPSHLRQIRPKADKAGTTSDSDGKSSDLVLPSFAAWPGAPPPLLTLSFCGVATCWRNHIRQLKSAAGYLETFEVVYEYDGVSSYIPKKLDAGQAPRSVKILNPWWQGATAQRAVVIQITGAGFCWFGAVLVVVDSQIIGNRKIKSQWPRGTPQPEVEPPAAPRPTRSATEQTVPPSLPPDFTESPGTPEQSLHQPQQVANSVEELANIVLYQHNHVILRNGKSLLVRLHGIL